MIHRFRHCYAARCLAAFLMTCIGVTCVLAHPTYESSVLGHYRLVDDLDRSQYADNTTLLKQHFAGENRGAKLQMMSIGDRRFFFQQGQVLDVTDPMSVTVVSDGQYIGRQVQVAYSQSSGKWILMTSAQVTGAGNPGLRGVRIYDVSDPANIVHLANYSTDRGDPSRAVQSGSGTHRNYWDGGKYAYLDSQMDDSFSNGESGRSSTPCQ